MSAVNKSDALAAREFIKNFVKDNIGKMSARDCARALGEKGYSVSRNAVIGIAHRGQFKMQMTGGSKSKGMKTPRNISRITRPRQDAGTFAPSIDAAAPTHPVKLPVREFVVTTVPTNPVSMSELKSVHCRWPLGEFAARPPYLFCGDPVFVGCYCMQHYQRSILGKNKETNHVVGAEARAGL